MNQMKEMKQKPSSEPEKLSAIKIGDTAFDIVRLHDGRSGWIKYDSVNGQSIVLNNIIEQGENRIQSPFKKIIPRSLILASGPGKPQAPKELFERIKGLISARFKMPSDQALDYLAAYILATYQFDQYSWVSYLSFVGPPGCGKSRLLSVTSQLAYMCQTYSGADSIAAFMRTMDIVRGTVAMDEAQRSTHDPADDFHKMLVSGNSRESGFIKKCSKDSLNADFEPREFYIFGPKIFGQRYSSSEEAMCSRTYEIELPRLKLREVEGANEDDPSWEVAASELRNDLLLYRQRRAVGELFAPSLKRPEEVAEWAGLSLRDLQVHRWILDECPCSQALSNIEEALSENVKRNNKSKMLNLEAEVLFSTLSLMREEGLKKGVLLSLIADRLRAAYGVVPSKTIGKILRGSKLELFRHDVGVKVRVNIDAVLAALEVLGLDPPDASFSSSST